MEYTSPLFTFFTRSLKNFPSGAFGNGILGTYGAKTGSGVVLGDGGGGGSASFSSSVMSSISGISRAALVSGITSGSGAFGSVVCLP
ncbi:hypothetical protein LINPERHAP1_LOCUS8174, partial [Linum perenne]